MSKQSTAAENLIGNFAPKLVELTDRVLFDDVWERKELSKRDRSLITVAALIALNRPDQLRFHLAQSCRKWRSTGRTHRSHHSSRVRLRMAGRNDSHTPCE